jgi:uncharacterized protein YbgA (DUF1722 family)/uncharacterized protein YbbK (DUF523 family)
MTDSTEKPVVVVSRCLGFDRCRYNGQMVSDPLIERLKEHVDFRPVCPELEIGLGVPRDPIRIISENEHRRLMQPASNRDVTRNMNAFTETYLASLQQADGFILKNRSPSCGIGDVKIYIGHKKWTQSVRGSGFFGGRVLKQYPDMPVEDEGRLRNFRIREHFLTKLYTYMRFRKMAKQMKALVEFHTNHKLLFLAYNQSHCRELGRIVANHEKKDVDTVIQQYRQELNHIFQKIPKEGMIINTLLHAFGGFSKHLSSQERSFFINSIEEYRDERIPLDTLNHLIHSYAIRFNVKYLLNQVFIRPYPKKLVAITDSGKGRDF